MKVKVFANPYEGFFFHKIHEIIFFRFPSAIGEKCLSAPVDMQYMHNVCYEYSIAREIPLAKVRLLENVTVKLETVAGGGKLNF